MIKIDIRKNTRVHQSMHVNKLWMISNWTFYDTNLYSNVTQACTYTLTLKRKSLHFDEMFITGCTGSCQNDNFQCSQWWKFRQNDDIFVSVHAHAFIWKTTHMYTWVWALTCQSLPSFKIKDALNSSINVVLKNENTSCISKWVHASNTYV